MPNKFAWFLTLAVFSGLSMNLILRFGIGLQRIALKDDGGSAPIRDSGKNTKWAFVVCPGMYFISVMLLWLFFSLLQSVLFLGFLEYILIFPVSSLFFTVVEYLARRLLLTTNRKGEAVSHNRFISDYFFSGLMTGAGQSSLNGAPVGGIPVGSTPVGAALFIILGLAGSFAQAAVLSFGFAAGTALAILIVDEIRRRLAMEAVPRRLRGGPLVLITMGLLSLVFTSVAVVFYTVLGAN
jgi:electron transport complex protein RnfA